MIEPVSLFNYCSCIIVMSALWFRLTIGLTKSDSIGTFRTPIPKSLEFSCKCSTPSHLRHLQGKIAIWKTHWLITIGNSQLAICKWLTSPQLRSPLRKNMRPQLPNYPSSWFMSFFPGAPILTMTPYDPLHTSNTHMSFFIAQINDASKIHFSGCLQIHFITLNP